MTSIEVEFQSGYIELRRLVLWTGEVKILREVMPNGMTTRPSCRAHDRGATCLALSRMVVVRGAAQADEPQPKRQAGGPRSTSLHQTRNFTTQCSHNWATTRLATSAVLGIRDSHSIICQTLVPQPQILCSSQIVAAYVQAHGARKQSAY